GLRLEAIKPGRRFLAAPRARAAPPGQLCPVRMEICFSYSRGGYFPLSCFNSAMSASTILHNHPADLVVASATSLRRILWRSPSLAGRPGYPDKDSPAGLP